MQINVFFQAALAYAEYSGYSTALYFDEAGK